MPDYTYCDYDALPAEGTKASSLVPNQFHKLCPGAHVQSGDGYSSSTKYSAFGQPRCGDGSNFSFFVSRPLKQLVNDKKILIEFQGGGACWDGDTCGIQEDYLTFPEWYDNFVGLSCSEIEYGAAVQGENPLSMLCSKKVGNTDFREYNTIVVPYCTQDVHIGDAPGVSYDGENYINHVGAHNMVRTLNWVFSNFPNPTHIFLTGCSAGGTAVPVAYDLINKHYNTFLKGGGGPLPRAVNINAIMDSSVYLTPSYFLQYGLPNWNPGTIMKQKLHFNFNKYQYQERYPDLLWNHILKRGSNHDRWGYVTHTTDPISLMYYQYMSGNGENGGGRLLASPVLKDGQVSSYESTAFSSVGDVEDHSRRMEDNNVQYQWWADISNSMEYVTKKHHNVDTFLINSEGHCSFGLYYPLQEEGFEEWASPIMKEGIVIGNRRPSVASFLTSVAFGGILIFLTRRMKHESGKKESLIEDGETSSYMSETATTLAKRVRCGLFLDKLQAAASPIVTKCQSWPWTAGYLMATAIYFLSMLITQGFAHPLDNPAFGPSAVGLSTFGINNPALIIYRMEHFRLITSSFLCSGVTTFLLVVYTIYKTALEAAMTDNGHPHWHFLLVAGVLSFGINLWYACIGNGASCSSLALALGLNAFSATLQRRLSRSYPSTLCFTITVFILGCTPLFPFDSLVALTVAVVTGVFVGLALFVEDSTMSSEPVEDVYHNESIAGGEPTRNPNHRVRWNLIRGMGALYLLQYILLLLRVPSPDKSNVYPYLTGCGLVYSNQIGDFVNAYAGNANNNGRSLGEEGNGGEDYFDGSNMCAQMCIPHLVYGPALWGVQKFASVPLVQGTCEENGYQEHIADKTFNEFTVTFEVQLFTASNDDD